MPRPDQFAYVPDMWEFRACRPANPPSSVENRVAVNQIDFVPAGKLDHLGGRSPLPAGAPQLLQFAQGAVSKPARESCDSTNTSGVSSNLPRVAACNCSRSLALPGVVTDGRAFDSALAERFDQPDRAQRGAATGGVEHMEHMARLERIHRGYSRSK